MAVTTEWVSPFSRYLALVNDNKASSLNPTAFVL